MGALLFYTAYNCIYIHIYDGQTVSVTIAGLDGYVDWTGGAARTAKSVERPMDESGSEEQDGELKNGKSSKANETASPRRNDPVPEE